MFFKLFSIEWTRLTHRAFFWVALAVCAFVIGFFQNDFYTNNTAKLLNGDLKMPGFSFDLATSLDQSMLIGLPFLVIMTAMVVGSDYSQRTNLHWLTRAPRPASLLAKFALLALVSFMIQFVPLLVGGGIGVYFRVSILESINLANVNWLATLSAPFYLTLVSLPYLALMMLITLVTRSAFFGAVIGLCYTQIFEMIFPAIFYATGLPKWLPTGFHISATYQLNAIGNKIVEIPDYLLNPTPAFVAAGIYTLILLAVVLWLYRRQDLGG